MPDSSITINGLKEVQQMLREAPKHIVAVGFAKALKSGGDVLAEAVEARTPERDEGARSGEAQLNDYPHLVDDIVVSVEVDTGAQGGRASVGFAKMGHVALQVEYGHNQVTHKPAHQTVGFTPAHPFMRPAFDAAGDDAIGAFSDSLTKTVKEEYKS